MVCSGHSRPVRQGRHRDWCGLLLVGTTQNIPNLLTGGNNGIGKETVKALLAKNAKVYIAGHSKQRVDATIQELKAETGNEAIFLELELASLSAVKAAAQAFQRLERKLDILINNA
jgi:NAD(P)-dependent dehydrogenase (short-subunit alcohol dehydrogenase family)